MYNKLNSGLEITWLGIIFLLPLWLNPWGYEVFYFAKSMLLQFMVALLLGLYTAQWILLNRGSNSVNGWQFVKKSPLQTVILFFGLAWLVSTLLSISPYTSVWGSMGRKAGLVSTVAWIIFFLIVADKIRSQARLYRALYALTFSAGIVASIGIIQFAWPGILPWYGFNDRVFSTVGNPLSLSGFLAVVLPVNAALIVLSWHAKPVPQGKQMKIIVLLVIFVLQFACLAFAQYSITLLLFIPGTFLFLLLWGIYLRKKAVVVLSVLMLAVLVIIAVVSVGQLVLPRTERTSHQPEPAVATFAGQVGLKTMDLRVDIWRCAISVAMERPEVPFYTDSYRQLRHLFGYGPETFIVTSQTRYPTAMKSQDTYSSVLLGQPENHYLYLWANNGLLGLAGFLAIIIIFLWLGYRLLVESRDKQAYMVAAALISAMLQYCIYILFNPSEIIQEYTLWLLASLMAAAIHIYIKDTSTVYDGESNTTNQDILAENKPVRIRKIAAWSMLSVLMLLGFTLVYSQFMADIKLSNAIRAWSEDANKAMADFAEAISLEPRESVNSSYIGAYAYTLADLSDNATQKATLIAFSAASYENAARLEPLLAYWAYTTGDVYSYWANHIDKEKWRQAITNYERADRQLPGNAVILDKWALALMLKGDYQEAGQKLDEAEKADPLWTQNSFYGGLLKSLQGDKEKASEMFVLPEKGDARLTSLIYKGPNDIDYFINFCRQAANYGVIDVVADNLKYYVDDKGDWIAWSFLGIADMYAKKSGEAIEAFSKSAELIPDEDVAVLKGVITAFPWNNHVLQAAANDITASLSARQTK